MSTQVAPWKAAIAAAEKKFEDIAKQTGNLVTWQREAMFAMQYVDASEFLQKCSGESIRNSVINVASVGLSLSPATKLAYLVPRKGKCCLDISYIGLVKIATDSGSVLAVKAELVREKDEFEYLDAFTTPRHKFNPFDPAKDRGDIIGVYVIAKLANGITQIETLSREEIDKIRGVSKAASGPWVEWFEEMCKKAAIKRASKLWPRSERLGEAERVLNEHQGNVTVIAPPPDDADDSAVKAAQEEVAKREETKRRIRYEITEAGSREALDEGWAKALAYSNETQDSEFYDEMKAIVMEGRKKYPKTKPVEQEVA